MPYRFNPPPGWPKPPEGWTPPQGWEPDPSWPAAPQGWQFWLDDGAAQADNAPAPSPGAGESETASAPVKRDSAGPDSASSSADAETQAIDQAPTLVPGQAGRPNSDASDSSDSGSGWGTPQATTAHDGGAAGGAMGGANSQAPFGPQGSYAPNGSQPGSAGAGGFYAGGPTASNGGFGEFSSPGGPQGPGVPGMPGMPGGPGGPGGPFEPSSDGSKSHAKLIVGIIIAFVLVVALVITGVWLINRGDGDSGSEPAQSQAPTATDPASPDDTGSTSSDDASGTSDDGSDSDSDDGASSPQPSTDSGEDDGSDDSGQGDTNTADSPFEVLTPDQKATIRGMDGDPQVEVKLLEVKRNWKPEGNSYLCSDPEGEYIALKFEFTTLPALSDSPTGSYTFIGFELGAANGDNDEFESNATAGLLCLGQDERLPSEMKPGKTYTGWAVIDVPSATTQVLWKPWLDFSGKSPTYSWPLSQFDN